MKTFYVVSNFLFLTTPYNFENNTYKKVKWRKLYVLFWFLFFSSFCVANVYILIYNRYVSTTNKVMIFVFNFYQLSVHSVLTYKAIRAYELPIKFFQEFFKFDNQTEFHEKTNWFLYTTCITLAELMLFVQAVLEVSSVNSNVIVLVVVDRLRILLFCHVDFFICHLALSLKQRFRYVVEQIRKISRRDEKTVTLIRLNDIHEDFLIMCNLVYLFNKIYGRQVLSVLLRTSIATLFFVNSVILDMVFGRHLLNKYKFISNIMGATSATVIRSNFSAVLN